MQTISRAIRRSSQAAKMLESQARVEASHRPDGSQSAAKSAPERRISQLEHRLIR